MRELINDSNVADIEPFYLDLGQLLSASRSRAGLTQERLGARLTPPMTRASVANIEAGKQRVLAKTLVDLAAALEVEVTKLIPGQPDQRTAVSKPGALQAELRDQLSLSAEQAKALAKQLETTGKRGAGK